MRPIRPGLLSKISRLTARFEGGGVLAGDFDGAVLSWGPLQWNIGSGTLHPLLVDLFNEDPWGATRIMGEAFGIAVDAGDEAFEQFARREILDPNRSYKGGGLRPKREWVEKFGLLERLPGADKIFDKHAEPYFEKAVKACVALGFHSERALALCKDIATQNGGVRTKHYERYYRSLDTHHVHEWERLKLLAIAVADSANPRWREDVLARKLGIAVGQGIVHGSEFHLEDDFDISYWRTWYVPPAWHEENARVIAHYA